MRQQNGTPAAASADGTARALEEYLAAVEAGAAPPRDEFLARHPELAEDLEACLAALRFIGRAAERPRSIVAEIAEVQPPEQAVGQLGDFRILREVGRGGMGVVYEAEQLSLGRRVALKVLPFAATMDPRQLQRFHNEARAAASLHHTNIVPVFGVGCERGVHFYAMQLIDGQSLAGFLVQERGGAAGTEQPTTACAAPPSPAGPAAETAVQAATGRAPRDRGYCRRVAEWGIQAAEALDCAHQMGVVHRDVKPANLLLDGTGRLWVTDFGLAQVQHGEGGLTMTGDLVGTLRYMSPEQALAQRVVIDHRTDVYSLGATLYELLTLEPVFGGGDRQELLRQIAFEEPVRPRRVHKAIPAELETIVLKAMEKNPADRYATAKELADDLHRFLADQPVRARRAGLTERARKWGRRHPTLVWSVTVGVVVAAVVLAGSAGWVARDAEARRAEAAAREAEIERAAGTDLHEAEGDIKAERWPEAARALERAEGRLAAGGPAPLRERLARLKGAITVVADLEKARDLASPNTGLTDNDPIEGVRSYAAAFAKYGLDPTALPPEVAARRVRDSIIHLQLVTALDEWSFLKERIQPGSGKPLQAVVRLADDDPQRRRLRDLLERRDWEGLKRFVAEEEVLDLPPPHLILIAQTMGGRRHAEGNGGLLRRAVRRYPRNFWVNAVLGATIPWENGVLVGVEVEGAIGFLRVALAVRPRSPHVQGLLGALLLTVNKLPEAEHASRKAIELRPGFYGAHLNLGAALRKQGKVDEAIACYREAVRLKPDYPEAHCNLGFALLDQGRFADALASLKRGHELGRDQPSDARYYAACAAALVGCGQGKGADKLDAEARARLRQLAVDWLRAELAARRKALERDGADAAPVVCQAMRHWQQDPDLAGVRGPDALAKMPEAERDGWRNLWADVERLLSRARDKGSAEKAGGSR